MDGRTTSSKTPTNEKECTIPWKKKDRKYGNEPTKNVKNSPLGPKSPDTNATTSMGKTKMETP